ncbi:MAG TPA: cytochrome C [Paenirhodobacter sp.]
MHYAAAIILPLSLAACLVSGVGSLPTPRSDFATYCADCHGDGGDPGALARELQIHPTPLADLTKMNEGNFPEARVMSKIVGYRQHGELVGAQAGQMPSFGDLADGPTVLYDSGDGIATPTPLRLVRLMEYIKGIQQ